MLSRTPTAIYSLSTPEFKKGTTSTKEETWSRGRWECCCCLGAGSEGLSVGIEILQPLALSNDRAAIDVTLHRCALNAALPNHRRAWISNEEYSEGFGASKLELRQHKSSVPIIRRKTKSELLRNPQEHPAEPAHLKGGWDTRPYKRVCLWR